MEMPTTDFSSHRGNGLSRSMSPVYCSRGDVCKEIQLDLDLIEIDEG